MNWICTTFYSLEYGKNKEARKLILGGRQSGLPPLVDANRVRYGVDSLLGAVLERVRLVSRCLASWTPVLSENRTRAVSLLVLELMAAVDLLRISIVLAELAFHNRHWHR